MKYEYDSRNQLKLAQDYTSDRLYQYSYSYHENGNINYEDYAVLYYDRASNSITGYVNGGRNEYSYNDSNWSDKVTYYKGAVSYDASGNPTSLDGATLQWENGRWLKSYSKGAVTSTYTYDSNGIRVSKYSSNSEKYTGENRDYTTVDGRITSEYVSGGGMGISSYDYRVYYRYDENNSPIGFDLIKDGTTTSYTYEKNIQGDIVGILNDSTRRRVVTYTYDAWGKVTSVTGTDAETVGKYNSLRYRGYYYDSETGYYYLQSRYYNPEFKRFINADDPKLITDLTKDSVLGGNLFAYCENNAVNKVDPDGQFVITSTMLICAGIGALVLGTVGGFAGYHLSKKWKVPKGKRWKYVLGGVVIGAAVGALIGGAVGYVIGPSASSGIVLWSGNGNASVFQAASSYAKKYGLRILEKTFKGRILNFMQKAAEKLLGKNLAWKLMKPLWRAASAQFAKTAQGVVHVFLNASGINFESTFLQIEYWIIRDLGVKIVFHFID